MKTKQEMRIEIRKCFNRERDLQEIAEEFKDVNIAMLNTIQKQEAEQNARSMALVWALGGDYA